MGDWDPTAAAAKAPPAARAPSRPFGEALARPLGAGPAKPPAEDVPRRATSAVAPQPSKPDAAAPRSAEVASKLAVPASPSNAGTARAPIIAGAVRSAAPVAPTAPAAKVAPVASPPARVPAPDAPAPPAASSNATAKPTTAVSPAAKLGAAPIAKPAIAKTAPTNAGLSDDRVRELHARLVEAKRQTQDAGSVSVEGLAKSLKATEAKLREQHKNRRIDFDVVIKDGKAVLKPIVR